MIDVDSVLRAALPRELFLDLDDGTRAMAFQAFDGVRRQFPMRNAKRSRGLEGQARFRLQEESFENIVQQYGGVILEDGILMGTDLRVHQPFARFPGKEPGDVGVILGFASMPEPRKMPPKNMSRAAGVTLNYQLEPDLFDDGTSVRPNDIFALFLSARDRERPGMIEEVAIGVIGGRYQDFRYYKSLDDFLSGYAPAPEDETDPNPSEELGKVVKLKQTRKIFIPPEKLPDTDVEDGAN